MSSPEPKVRASENRFALFGIMLYYLTNEE